MVEEGVRSGVTLEVGRLGEGYGDYDITNSYLTVLCKTSYIC